MKAEGVPAAPSLSESDMGYYRWRVVLAARFGVMAGFGSLFVYTFAVFAKPLGVRSSAGTVALSRAALALPRLRWDSCLRYSAAGSTALDLAASIVSRWGWRAAYASLGCLALLLGLPLSWRYVHERDHIRHDSPRVAHSGMTWQQGMRSYAFWIIVAVLFVGSISMNGAITHLAALLTDRGITPRNAALCASMLGGASLLGRISVGWLLDRFFGACVALVVGMVSAGGILLLARANSFPPGCLAAALIGVGAGGEAASHLTC